jgi:flavin reductase (DIM6/NTAB) family NADH-FMN oxidoreductase RutF
MSAPFIPPDDPAALRRAFATFPSGVVALCAMSEGEPVGFAASSFTSVSIEPPLVSVCVQTKSNTWKRLQTAPRIGVSILGEDQSETCRRLAGPVEDRFVHVEWHALDNGAVFIEKAAARLDCSLFQAFEAGDHVIALLRIHAMSGDPEVRPLIFHGSRFGRLSAV